MRNLRRHLCKAAGVFLTATAAGSALAQGVPGSPTLVPLGDDLAPPRIGAPVLRPVPTWRTTAAPSEPAGEVETLPPPRTPVVVPPAPAPAPAAPAVVVPGATGCGSGVPAGYRPRHKANAQACMWGYPAEFVPVPLGQSVHAPFQAMVANGEAARMVLYRYDFVEGSDALNLRGRDQLGKIAALMGHNNFPLIVERTPEAPAVAEARRMAVLNILGHNGVAVAPERVVIGVPIAHGLSGYEAEVIAYPALLRSRLTQSEPIPATGVSSTGVIGFGGAGTGAGAGSGVQGSGGRR
jgi:hypothetical protein